MMLISKGKKIVRRKWIFSTQYKVDEFICQYKAYLWRRDIHRYITSIIKKFFH